MLKMSGWFLFPQTEQISSSAKNKNNNNKQKKLQYLESLDFTVCFFYLDRFLRVAVNQEPQPKHVCVLFLLYKNLLSDNAGENLTNQNLQALPWKLLKLQKVLNRELFGGSLI